MHIMSCINLSSHHAILYILQIVIAGNYSDHSRKHVQIKVVQLMENYAFQD